jgi:hypothetical protein
MGDEGCLGCALVERAPVTLVSGTVVCNECPEWRHECEIRYIVSLPSKEARQKYLRGVEERRGKTAAQRIIADLWALHRREEECEVTPE